VSSKRWQEAKGRDRQQDREQGRAAAQAMYNTSRWRKLRARQLETEPLCRMCQAQGLVTEATVCDHVEPHRGDEVKFWAGPFQSLCRDHHNGAKQRQEQRGVEIGCDADGYPIGRLPGW